MLQHKYARCPFCFAKFTPTSCVLAAQFACQMNATTDNRLKLAAAWTRVGFSNRAMRLLGTVDSCSLRDLEIARALVTAGDARRSMPFSLSALDAFAEHAEDAQMYAEALLLLGQAHVDLMELRSAAEVTMIAIDMVSSMSAEQAIEVMKIIGQIGHRRGDQRLRAAAHETICRIVDEEEPDPRARA